MKFFLLVSIFLFGQMTFAKLSDETLKRSALLVVADKYKAFNENPTRANFLKAVGKNMSKGDREFLEDYTRKFKKLPTFKVNPKGIEIGKDVKIEVKHFGRSEILVNGYAIRGKFKTLRDRVKYMERVLAKQRKNASWFHWLVPSVYANTGLAHSFTANSLMGTQLTGEVKALTPVEMTRKALLSTPGFGGEGKDTFNYVIDCKGGEAGIGSKKRKHTGVAEIKFQRSVDQQSYKDFDLVTNVNYAFTGVIKPWGDESYEDLWAEHQKSLKIAEGENTPSLLGRALEARDAMGSHAGSATKKAEPIDRVYGVDFRFNESLGSEPNDEGDKYFPGSTLQKWLTPEEGPSPLVVLSNAAVLCCASEEASTCETEINKLSRGTAEHIGSGRITN